MDRTLQRAAELLRPELLPDIPPAEIELPISYKKPTKVEIEKAIMTLRNGKAARPDGIPAEAIKAINSDLGKIDKWYEENEMRRNHNKYKAMVMGKMSRDPVFKCKGTSIPLVEEMELLGVTVNNKLKFEGQIKEICRKVSQQIAVLKRMKKLLPLQLWENLYRAFIAPHFNYCAESWHFCGNRLTEKLKKLNERALRFVYQDKNSPYETLIVKNGYSTLANQRLAKMLSTVSQAIGNGNVPSSVSKLLTARNSNYNLRGDAILKLPKVSSTKYGIKSWRYQAARQWNTIPNNLRNIDTYRSFKRGLKELDLVGL